MGMFLAKALAARRAARPAVAHATNDRRVRFSQLLMALARYHTGSMQADDALRKQLIHLLQKSEAHAGFDKTVKGVPAGKMGVRPTGSPHSAWELLEHIRLAQRDILEFSRSAKYQPRKWPDDYWPKSPKPK